MREFDGHDPYARANRLPGGLVRWALSRVVLWGGIGLALYILFGNVLTHTPKQAASPAAPVPESAANAPAATHWAPPNTLVYHADPRGHVLLEGAVNGAPVRFLVDTGSTLVALTPRDAEAAGISSYDLVFNTQVETANGVARVAPITLREVRLQQFTVYDVPANVVENLSVSLLGMSFLNRLQSYEMRQGVLTLNW